MFKKALLTLTALTAISLAQTPHIAPAEAAVKIKPATVKLKTKIRVAKPKARVKIKRAKVRVKVRNKLRVRVNKKVRVKAAKVRVKKPKTKTKTAKIPLKPQVHGLINGKQKPIRIRTVRPVVKVKPNLKHLAKKPQAEPRAVVAKLQTKRNNQPPFKLQGPRRTASPTSTGYPSFKYPDPAFQAQAARLAEVGRAASLADDLKDLAATLRIAGHSAGELNLFGINGPFAAAGTPDTGDLPAENAPLRPPSGMETPGALPAGFAGPDSDILFGMLGGERPEGPRNARHGETADTAQNRFAVTPQSIAAAMKGAASSGEKETTRSQEYRNNVAGINRVGNDFTEAAIVKNRADGTSTVIINRHTDEFNGETGWHTYRERTVTEFDSDGTQTERQSRGGYITDLTERRNPDYADGSTCQNISCIIGGEQPKGLSLAETKNGASPGGLPPAPEDANHTRQATAPLYTANDVLERYDPDSTDQGGGGSPSKNAAGPGGFPEDPNS